MALAETLKEIAKELADLGKDAVSDIGSTYQAVLMQDTGWRITGHTNGATQDIAEQVAKESMAINNEIGLEIDR